MIVITGSEISFLKNKTVDDITAYLVRCIDDINDNYSILFISYDYSKEVLLSKFNNLDRDNITIIDDATLTFDKMEQLIIKREPKYVFIDYFNLKKTKRCMYVNGLKLNELKKKFEEYEDKYNVRFIVIVNDRG